VRLLSLEIENWGPYLNTQTLDLDTSPTAPLILIEGENERGKTTLFQGMRFALYGKMEDHDGNQIDVSELANWDARDAGDPFWFGVTLRFEHDQKEIEISRRRRGDLKMRSDGPSVEILDRRDQMRVIGGNPFPEKDIDDHIQRILHSDIASFFLFDGETLTRVERLLKSQDSAAIFVRENLERALGVPALRLLSKDLDHLADSAGEAVRQAAKAMKHNKEAQERYERADDDYQRAQKDLDELEQLRRQVERSLEETNGKLAEVDAVKEIYYERKGLLVTLAQEESDLQGAEEAARQLMENNWWIPIADQLKQASDEAVEALAEHAERAENKVALSHDLERLRKQLKDTVCHTCGQDLPEAALAPLRERESDLLRALESEPETESLQDIRLKERRMRVFQEARAIQQQLLEFEGDIRRCRMRIIDHNGKIDRLTERIKDTNLDIAALDAQAADDTENLVRIDIAIADANERRDKAIKERRAATEAITTATGAGGIEANAELSVLRDLGTYVDDAMGDFRNRMRMRIQEEATDIFKQLTTEEEYSGLRIDGNYYLSIVDSNDRVVTRRSAGANQVVTMSLIGALAKCAVEEGPIVMDTPFARLDMGHRARILKWTAALGSQVVLFVQSGEFDRSRDLKHLDGRVGCAYVLRRVGTSSTKIERYGND
jgi:DNA sulfur modification protein DndD